MPKLTHRILVAEDEPDIRDLITLTLQFGGFEVVSVADGSEAVAVASTEQVDLILLDVRMPRMSGYDACRVIKSQESTNHIPIIFLSAKGQESEVKAGLEAGADAYILKPFAPGELMEKIKSCLST